MRLFLFHSTAQSQKVNTKQNDDLMWFFSLLCAQESGMALFQTQDYPVLLIIRTKLCRKFLYAQT